MIRYSLICEQKHDFEIWFKNSSDYDKQAKRGLVTCPACGSAEVEKGLMAPALGRGTKKDVHVPIAETAPTIETPVPTENKTPVAMISPQEQEFRAKLKELRDQLTKNADNVGAKFPEEARKMHYGESEHRSIYGEATPQEAQELLEEGVELHPLPVLPEERN